MPIPREKIEIIKKWKEVASQMEGRHFNFSEQKKRIAEITQFVDEFISNPSEKSFRKFWDRLYAAIMKGGSKNMIKRFKKASLSWEEIAKIIIEIKKSDKYILSWEKQMGFKASHISTISELYGVLHIKDSPINNGASIYGLKFFNYKFKNSYGGFEEAFDEFRNEYLTIVGSPVTMGTGWEVPINLEIDQLFNCIDKIKNKLNVEEGTDEDEKKFYETILNIKENEKNIKYFVFRTSLTKREWIWEEIQKGKLRRGWGGPNTQLLERNNSKVHKKTWIKRYIETSKRIFDSDPSEKDGNNRYKTLSKMLNINENDLIVVPKMPENDKFIIIEANIGYEFDYRPASDRDYYEDHRHVIDINPKSIKIFDYKRNGDVEIIRKSFSHYQGPVNNVRKKYVIKAIDALYMDGKPEPINKSFFDFLTEKGFLFETEIIENLLLSLKVKPFVILTGNSGTGKTKIAQLFAQYLDEKKKNGTVMNNSEELLETSVNYTAKSIKNSYGWTLKKGAIAKLIGKDDIYLKANIAGIDAERCKLEFKNIFYYKYDKNKDLISKTIEDKYNLKDDVPVRIYIPGIEKSNSMKQIYQIIPVGANWTENRHIVGFHNVITNQYQPTKSLNLMLAARKDREQPYFLVLDEMNLSHVERYFADFLSGIESEETIPLHSCDEITDIPQSLKLSPNLSIIGTVNVDETTYMFSPKVLDRANTIEFFPRGAGEYMGRLFEGYKQSGDVKYLENVLSDVAVRDWNIGQLKDAFAGVKTSDGKDFWPVLTKEIDIFQKSLKTVGFEFGFRVINEIVRFMYVAWRYEGGGKKWDNWERYFDAQIKQKMLPKVHGSQRTLGNLFTSLMELCLKKDINKELKKKPRQVPDDEIKDSNYSSSASKIKEMAKVLYNQRYVSFTR